MKPRVRATSAAYGRRAVVLLLLFSLSVACSDGSGGSAGPGSGTHSIAITSPQSGLVSSTPTVDVEGTAQAPLGELPNLHVELLGLTYPLAADGGFSIPGYLLLDGQNDIVVELHDGTGPVASASTVVTWDTPSEASGIIDPAVGGTIEVVDAGSAIFGTAITIPPGAATEALSVSILDAGEHASNLKFAEVAVGPAVTYTPISTGFLQPITLRLPIDSGKLPAGTTFADVHVWAETDSGLAMLSQSFSATSYVEVQTPNLELAGLIPAVTVPLAPGELRIISDPAYATVYLDGFDTELRTPVALSDVAAGPHQLKLYLPTFNEVFTDVTLPPTGGTFEVVLGAPLTPIPEIVFDPSIFDGLVVFDSLFEITGTALLDGSPMSGGTLVVSLNGHDTITNIFSNGHISAFISLLPGDNFLQLRANSSAGSTGVTETILITNAEAALTADGLASDFVTVTLTWGTNNSDVDMHVFDPNGNHAWYGSLGGIPGGMLDHDDTDGFGPEIFTLPDPSPGTYKVNVDYFSDHGTGPTTASLLITVGSEQVFSGSYHFTADDFNETSGSPLGANPAAFWEAATFEVDPFKIVSAKTSPTSPSSSAVFTTHPNENTIHITTKAPSSILDSEIHYRIKETVEDYDVDVSEVTGREVNVSLTHKGLSGLVSPPKSHPLTYEIVAFTTGSQGKDQETQPYKLKQGVKSQVRQEYVDKHDYEPLFTVATPPLADIIDQSGYPSGYPSITYQELAQKSDFGPGLTIIKANIVLAQTLQDAWGHELRVTSAWRNPRRNDALPDSKINSKHQTGNAVDTNPTVTSDGWPTGTSTYAQAQQKLFLLAKQKFPSPSYFVDLHGGDPHVHIQQN